MPAGELSVSVSRDSNHNTRYSLWLGTKPALRVPHTNALSRYDPESNLWAELTRTLKELVEAYRGRDYTGPAQEADDEGLPTPTQHRNVDRIVLTPNYLYDVRQCIEYWPSASPSLDFCALCVALVITIIRHSYSSDLPVQLQFLIGQHARAVHDSELPATESALVERPAHRQLHVSTAALAGRLHRVADPCNERAGRRGAQHTEL
jgi:hypothetical protein